MEQSKYALKYPHLSYKFIDCTIQFFKWMKNYKSIELIESLQDKLFYTTEELSKVACKLNDEIFLKNIQIDRAYRTLKIFIKNLNFNPLQKAIIYNKFLNIFKDVK